MGACDGRNPALKFWVIRSDGQRFDFGRGGWMITDDGFENAANLAYNVSSSKNVLTDGSALISKRVEETDRTIKAEYNGEGADAARSAAIAFFNPRFSFELHATYRGKTRWCAGEQTGFKMSSGKYSETPAFSWTLLCLDPFWRNENGHTESFTDSRPMFGFPYVCKTKGTQNREGKKLTYGAPASILVYDGENTVYNDGDVPCMYRIVMEVNGGSVVNPVFTKDNKFVKVAHAFQDGDTLLIDFESAPPVVEINGVNAIQNCTRDSSFTGMEMQPGDNVFDYSCDERDTHRPYMDVKLLYNDRYLGI